MLVARGQNTAGTYYRVYELKNGNGLVYKLCENYNGSVRGGMTRKFVFVAPKARMTNKENNNLTSNGMPMADAMALYEKRLKGKVK